MKALARDDPGSRGAGNDAAERADALGVGVAPPRIPRRYEPRIIVLQAPDRRRQNDVTMFDTAAAT